jgi:UDP-2,4-diacetamido-2,4,6-trideoxy-beta-L-altropyranose hydrolase
VFFGGTDPSNQTAKALEAIGQLCDPRIAVDVVVGRNNPHRQKLRTICQSLPNTSFHCQVRDMAERMAAADLSIGAGGIATWERCFLGLPSITVAISSNQQESLENAATNGCVVNLGADAFVTVRQLRDTLSSLMKDPARLSSISGSCLDVTRRQQGQDQIIDSSPAGILCLS